MSNNKAPETKGWKPAMEGYQPFPKPFSPPSSGKPQSGYQPNKSQANPEPVKPPEKL
jgi:hypothetical protein